MLLPPNWTPLAFQINFIQIEYANTRHSRETNFTGSNASASSASSASCLSHSMKTQEMQERLKNSFHFIPLFRILAFESR